MDKFRLPAPSPASKPSAPPGGAGCAYEAAAGKVTWKTVHPGTDS